MPVATVTTDSILAAVPADRKGAFSKLLSTIREHLPHGFTEQIAYGMISFVVPHSRYPQGYHCNPKQALPFLSIASQKNFIAFYHMGMYASPELLEWFTGEFPVHSKKKLDMGKSCVRFKKPDDIPFELIGQLVEKMDPDAWIRLYEKNLKR